MGMLELFAIVFAASVLGNVISSALARKLFG